MTTDPVTSLSKMEGDHPDTVPGFMMQSQNFVLKFISGLQKGVVSKLLEMETDWLVQAGSFVLLMCILMPKLMVNAPLTWRGVQVRHDGDHAEQTRGRAHQPRKVPFGLSLISSNLSLKGLKRSPQEILSTGPCFSLAGIRSTWRSKWGLSIIDWD